LFAKFIPVLGTALSRAQEYSCDRIALQLCPEGKHGIFLLLLGRHLYKNVNIEEYLLQAKRTRGLLEFLVNINATHPVNTRRVLALYKPEKKARLLF
jgi:Zn-dependent protease with chaperone function